MITSNISHAKCDVHKQNKEMTRFIKNNPDKYTVIPEGVSTDNKCSAWLKKAMQSERQKQYMQKVRNDKRLAKAKKRKKNKENNNDLFA